MILLNAPYVTTVTTALGGQSQVVTTDTLFVSEVKLDFESGKIYATIQRGTGSPFVANMPPLKVGVNPDGSFWASEGSWAGAISGGISALLSSLQSQFDQMLLASGAITGT